MSQTFQIFLFKNIITFPFFFFLNKLLFIYLVSLNLKHQLRGQFGPLGKNSSIVQ